MPKTISEQLALIKQKNAGKTSKKVAILGAGMAGLAAAYELRKLGHEVVVYEASKRVGGRAWTRHFDDGQYHEFGAMRFPASHDFTRHYASLCGLKFRKFLSHHNEENGFYFIKNRISFHHDFDLKVLPGLNLTEEELDLIENGPIREKPEKLQNLFVGPLVALLKRTVAVEDDVKALFWEGPMTPQIRYLESISLGDFVRSHLESTDAVDLIGAITGLEVWWDRAITMFLRDEIVGTGDGLEEIIGGTSLLPEGLNDLLAEKGGCVQFSHEVVSINRQRDKIQIAIRKRDEKGQPVELIDFTDVLCTIPFSVLRRIELHGISEAKMRAIRNLSYASSTKVLLDCKQRFWELGAKGIIGGGSQTDLINRTIYYPSDNFKEADTTEETPKSSVTRGLFTASNSVPKAIENDSISKGPGVIVGSYNWGADARRLGGMSESERTRTVVEVLSNIHPELKDPGMVVDSASMFWDENPWAGGAFCFMKPGDLLHYYEDAIKPEGNLHFAGEHCSLDQAWIQGALISALRSVEKIVDESETSSASTGH